jgi:hypothetical protein
MVSLKDFKKKEFINFIRRLHEFGQERYRPCELEAKPTDEKYYLKHYELKNYGI